MELDEEAKWNQLFQQGNKHEKQYRETISNQFEYSKLSLDCDDNFILDLATVVMLLVKSARKRSKIPEKIMTEISRKVITIRPNRKFERRMTVRANKHSVNNKRLL
ncbi:hypothetical protein CLTEP_24600 [Clostridium tepidiprofundi DSM 19306]|uniref:Uncharacterized protein n=1 Tax=Clostridium tepidiprofundi DSM 19306 TaxID=1121338 RepID=A0A151ATG0_9CLOT|nr:hypothetical protein [Clostridium tepidiprofundi]KYH30938.1 hypothetical protein CLTEP_24600 [Clostridium tepidiprofundi DSM 19306]